MKVEVQPASMDTALAYYRSDVVVVMNPIYRQDLGIEPQFLYV